MCRSYSSVLRENNSLKEKNKRLRKDCDEKEKSVQKYKGRLGQAKKILEKRSGQAKKAPKIPHPGGAFGRSWVDGDGNTRQSLSLKDEMQIDQTEYLKLRVGLSTFFACPNQ
ncbi:hypothetical protein CPB86DRAFT_290147 [Serendipita vermifera]|nr:hypothetical protein CPB86DRAFT_290147 [Serendipita vermifera]